MLLKILYVVIICSFFCFFIIDYDILLSFRAKKSQLYDDKGILLESLADLCDCLDKNCPGCHYPCQRCGSTKCGVDCRCNRKYVVDLIEVEGTDAVYTFPT